MQTVFYILRHGQTQWNAEKRIQGQKNPPLNARGHQEAETISQALRDVEFNLIFSSDLLRAKQTADTIASKRSLTVQTSSSLRERYYGQLEGKKDEEVHKDPILKELIRTFENQSVEKSWSSAIVPDMESDEKLADRLIKFLRELTALYPGKKILVISHGGPIRVLLMQLGFVPKGSLRSRATKNGGYIVLTSDGTDFFVKETKGISINET